MTTNTSDTTRTLERRTARSIHYTISYLVHGAEHGSDGAIVLLHDIPAGAFAWEGIIPLLASSGRAVYAFDMLGYGESDHPWPADTSIWGHADVLSILFKELGLNNIILIGHGLGGGVAQVLATRLHREQTQAIILINTICYLYSFAPNWPLQDMEKQQDFEAPKHTSSEDLLANLRTTLPQAVANQDEFSKGIDRYIDPWKNEIGKEVLFQHIRLLIPNYMNSVSSDLAVVNKPMLIIWGEQDGIIPLKYGKRLNREIPNSKLVVVPNAGHLILFDAPDAIADLINNFVTGL